MSSHWTPHSSKAHTARSPKMKAITQSSCRTVRIFSILPRWNQLRCLGSSRKWSADEVTQKIKKRVREIQQLRRAAQYEVRGSDEPEFRTRLITQTKHQDQTH